MAPRASARSATPCWCGRAGLAGVEIDARAHRARIKAGARWADLADRASFLGLAPAGGFDRQASIVGTVLGDGMGWLARRHGLAAAERDRRRVRDRRGRARAGGRRRGQLLRALRGGGVITALELTLHPAEDLYAGALFFSFDRAAEVLHAWRDWTETAPPEITSVGRLMQFGDGLEVAELVRGRSFVVDRGRLPRRRGRRRRADRPAARPAARARHVHDRAAVRARAPAHGARAPGRAACRRRTRRCAARRRRSTTSWPSPAPGRARRSPPWSCGTRAGRWRRWRAGSSPTRQGRRPTRPRRPRSRRSSPSWRRPWRRTARSG